MGHQPASVRPEIDVDGTRTAVLVEQLAAIDPEQRLGRFAGRLSHDELQAVDAALLAVLGLD